MNRFKKISIGLMLSIFLFITVAGNLAFVRSANAMPVEVGIDVPRITEQVLTKLGKMIEISILSAAVNAVSYFTRKVAYDMAVSLASGNWGQGPFAHNQDWGAFMKDTLDHAVGNALGELGLCHLPDVQLDLALRIGLHQKFDNKLETADGCTFTSAWSEWQPGSTAWKSQYGGEAMERRFNTSFNVDQSDFGIFLTASERVNQVKEEESISAVGQRTEGKGYKGVTDLISGDIKTPADVMAEQFKATGPAKQNEASQAQIMGAMSAGAAQILPSALSVFMNTFAVTMMNRLITKGMLPPPTGAPEEYAGTGAGPQATGRRAAEEMFRDFLTAAQAISSVESYDLLAEMSTCPDNPGPYNCVIDAGLVSAIQQANYDFKNPVTIAEAIDKGWLNGSYKLLPPSRQADNEDKNCYGRAYCYGNLVILRKARVLPVGVEIAAMHSNPDSPWTLDQVVKGFNDCSPNGQIDLINKPFCHLVDPNWVIKLPATRCGAMAYGPTLLGPGIPERQQECVDLQSCVGFNANGTCYAYGYCTKEKNIWRFDADKCDAQNRSCRAFTKNGQEVSYLYRTLDTGSCNMDNAGCLAYSTWQEGGEWQVPSTDNTIDSYNTGIHFNKNISAGLCSSGSAGCSAYKLSSSQDTLLYLRKAPDYLKCYDARPNTAVLDWPQNASDLQLLRPADECKNYAKPCIPAEENCNLYTPQTGLGITVPGKFKPFEYVENQIVWNDNCDKTCVGYDAYKELDSNYANGHDISYIIPSSDQRKCNANEDGCASFTNLSVTPGGMEQVEYYAYLRPCIKPDVNQQKNYYTYEGSLTEGYQLKTYTLVKGADGDPQYFYRTSADLTDYSNRCSAASYNTRTADPDCRQFIDDAGNTSYKLLERTVAVSDSCTNYRLNSSEMYESTINTEAECTAQKGLWQAPKCQLCFQQGEYRDGFCFYSGLPGGAQNTAGISRACTAAAETCRAYKGNTGNNIERIFSDNFENSVVVEALAGWGSTRGAYTVSAESTRAGEHSLGYTSSAADDEVFKTIALKAGESYNLTFWAKGTAQEVEVSLNNGQNFILGSAAVGDVWRQFQMGPVVLGEGIAGATGKVVFKAGTVGRLFIDNIQLTRVKDLIYLVKKNLSVDINCDSNPDDNLPGMALGCAEYKNPAGVSYYLTNFSYLCREDAVGCAAVLDTYNTIDDAGSRTYNVWIEGAGGTSVSLLLSLNIEQNPRCSIPVGGTGCYVNVSGHSPDYIIARRGMFVTSTFFVPADTPTSSPQYLVASQDSSCDRSYLGCINAGAQTLTPNGPVSVTTTVKNDPALYDKNVLCTSEAVGCDSYTSGDGTYYFKDPLVTGQKVCSYRTGVTVGSSQKNGWFWKGVGICWSGLVVPGLGIPQQYCSTNNDCGVQKVCNLSGRECASNQDCGAGEVCEDSCVGIGDQPCYPDYLVNGSMFDLWSYGVKNKYDNFVGECPAAQSGCTEFVDHNDKDTKYDFILNDKIKSGNKQCGDGLVSEREGCILLDNADSPNKLWNTAASYARSADEDYKLVPPVPNQSNDANTIVKVARDRECAEWTYCRNMSGVHDPETGKNINKCYGLGVCNKAQPGSGSMTGGTCVDDISGDDIPVLFKEDLYRRRGVAWKDVDYSGYATPNQYPLSLLEPVAYGEGTAVTSTSHFLVMESPDRDMIAFCANAGNNNKPCGDDNNRDMWLDGICTDRKCVYPINGVSVEEARNITEAGTEPLACRGYPEKDSPYDSTVQGAGGASFKQGFENVNVCRDATCDCNYNKVEYGRGANVTYYDYNNLTLPRICDGSIDYQGMLCVTDQNADAAELLKAKKVLDTACVAQGGKCMPATLKTTYSGWQGYCVERDVRRRINGTDENACLTWWPVDIVAGARDVFNENASARYNAVTGDRYLCLVNRPLIVQKQSIPFQFSVTDADPFTGAGMCYSQFSDELNPLGSGGHARVFPNNEEAKEFNLLQVEPARQDIRHGIDPRDSWICYETLPTGNYFYYYGVDVPDRGFNKTNSIDAKVVANNYYTINSSGDNQDHVEHYVPLRYADVFNSAPGDNDVHVRKDDIKRVDVYFDWDDHAGLTNITPNVISFNINNFYAGVEVNNLGMSLKGPANSLNTGNITYRENGQDKTLTYYEYNGNIRNFYMLDGAETDNNPEVTDLDNQDWGVTSGAQKTGYGVRLYFDENYLRGALVDLEDVAAGNAYLGFFFVIHFTNGKCETLGKVSDAGLGNKAVAWRMAKDAVDFNGSDMGSDRTNVMFKRKQIMQNPQYGLVQEGGFSANTALWVNPFITDTSNPPEPTYSDLFDKELKEPWIKGGVPLTVYNSQNSAADYMFGDNTVCNVFSKSTSQESYCSMLQYMFAKQFGLYKLNNTGTGYNANWTDDSFISDVSSPQYSRLAGTANTGNNKPYTYRPPKIAAVDMTSCSEPLSTGCGIAALDAFNVGTEWNKDVVARGTFDANIRFYAWADAAQMPLRRVKIDFNNDTVNAERNNTSHGNFKPFCGRSGYCGADETNQPYTKNIDPNIPCTTNKQCRDIGRGDCQNNSSVDIVDSQPFKGFGNTVETGCVQQYIEFRTTYNCDLKGYVGTSGLPEIGLVPNELRFNRTDPFGGSGHVAEWVRGNPTEPYQIQISNEAIQAGYHENTLMCAFVPRVQVLDNWGWCSGSCEGTDLVFGLKGCYNDTAAEACKNNPASWIKYNKYVIVVPQ